MAITKEYTVYTFDELTEGAKERAREWFRNTCIDGCWNDEYRASIQAFVDHFGADLVDWNIGPFAPLYFTVRADNACFRGRKLRDFDPDYMPTGFCADCDLWGTFHKEFKRTGNAKQAFKEAVYEGFKAWRNAWESPYEDKQVDESILVNEYTFDINGNWKD